MDNEPKKEEYGFVSNNTFDGEPSGWMIEGGEEAYNKARKAWAEEDAPDEEQDCGSFKFNLE